MLRESGCPCLCSAANTGLGCHGFLLAPEDPLRALVAWLEKRLELFLELRGQMQAKMQPWGALAIYIWDQGLYIWPNVRTLSFAIKNSWPSRLIYAKLIFVLEVSTI